MTATEPGDESTEAEDALMERTDLYMKYLEDEGYRPSIQADLIIFKKEGGTYVVVTDDNDPEYVQILYPGFWPIDSDEERQAAVRAANQATGRTKVGKVFLTDEGDNVNASLEAFLKDPEDFAVIFDRTLLVISTAVQFFREGMAEA